MHNYAFLIMNRKRGDIMQKVLQIQIDSDGANFEQLNELNDYLAENWHITKKEKINSMNETWIFTIIDNMTGMQKLFQLTINAESGADKQQLNELNKFLENEQYIIYKEEACGKFKSKTANETWIFIIEKNQSYGFY